MVAKEEAVEGIKKAQSELARLMKTGGPDAPKKITEELFAKTGSLVFRDHKGFNGHEEIAKAFKDWVNIDCVINNEEVFVTENGEYVVARGHMDVGDQKNCPFEKVYKRVDGGKYILLHDEFGNLASK
ncbi:hypothetical protein AAVH_31254 [Aphelenchoides avenae]|nr:hypothetical protein AAVH_31254 [Aphelenchus avenae]